MSAAAIYLEIGKSFVALKADGVEQLRMRALGLLLRLKVDNRLDCLSLILVIRGLLLKQVKQIRHL